MLSCPRPILSESNSPLIIRTNISRDFVHFEKADFDCPRPQYELIGDASITCLPDGTWSSSLPSCKSKQFFSYFFKKLLFLNYILLFLLLLIFRSILWEATVFRQHLHELHKREFDRWHDCVSMSSRIRNDCTWKRDIGEFCVQQTRKMDWYRSCKVFK